jgi:D-glycerate 3-kinase
MTAQLLHHVLQFLRPHLGTRQGRPLIVGISGAQGSGKSTVTTQLAAALGSATAVPYRDYSSSLVVATLSIDDVYLTHAAQQELATKNPQNPLVQHRGVPGTHDLPLARQVLEALGKGKETTMLPRYDKSAFGGEGDRAEPSPVHGPVDVVLFEGWCVGFRALGEAELRDACTRGGVVKEHRMQDLVAMNQALKEYDALTEYVFFFFLFGWGEKDG